MKNTKDNLDAFICCIEYSLDNPLIASEIEKDLSISEAELKNLVRTREIPKKLFRWVAKNVWGILRAPDFEFFLKNKGCYA